MPAGRFRICTAPGRIPLGGYGDLVSVTRRRQWGRVLVVLALILGVVAMHALVMPMGDDHPMPVATSSGTAAGPMPTAASTALHIPPMATPVVVAGDSSPLPGMPSGAHALMHLCLAVLAAMVVLGLSAMAVLVRLRRARIPGSRRVPVATVWPRPPPRTAIRLAQLCVLRN